MFFVHIAGHLGKDPETRFTPTGQKVTSFTIATKQRKGKEDVTIWVRVTIWGDRFDKMMPFLKKGSAVIVMGRMNPPSSYTDKEGRTQCSLEVTAEALEFSPFGKGDRPESGMSHQSSGSHEQAHGVEDFSYQSSHSVSGQGQGSGFNTSDEDDLPF